MASKEELSPLNGYLSKRGPSSLTGWKQRWFEVRDEKLQYFKSPGDSECIGFIPLRIVNCVFSSNDVPGISSKQQGCTFIVDTGERVYYLLANSRDEMWKWVEGLEKHRKVALQNWEAEAAASAVAKSPTQGMATIIQMQASSSSLTKSKGDDELREAVVEDGVMKGYLTKRGPSSLTGFKQRWFEVSEEKISYYRAKGDSEPIAVIPIECVNYVTPSNNIPGLSKKHFGSAFLIDTESRIFYLVASTKEDMWKWVDTIAKFRKKSTESPDSSSDLVELNAFIKKAPYSGYEKFLQILDGSDFSLVAALSEISHDKMLISTCVSRLKCLKGEHYSLMRWAALHTISSYSSIQSFKKWQPNVQHVPVSVLSSYFVAYDHEFLDALCWVIDPQMDKLRLEKSSFEVVKFMVETLSSNWSIVSKPIRFYFFQAMMALHLKFVTNEVFAVSGAVTLVLLALLSPSVPTISPSVLELEARSKTDLPRSRYINMTFEQISSMLFDDDDDQGHRADVFAHVHDLLATSESLRTAFLKDDSYVFEEDEFPAEPSESEEKEILGILHHQFCLHPDKILTYMSRNYDLYSFIRVQLEPTEGNESDDTSEGDGKELRYEVTILDSPLSDSAPTPAATQTTPAKANSRPSSQTSTSSPAKGKETPCERPQCGCLVFEPHLWLKDKCRSCLHTKSEHIAADEFADDSSSTKGTAKAVNSLKDRKSIDFEKFSNTLHHGIPKPLHFIGSKKTKADSQMMNTLEQAQIVLAVYEVGWMREKLMNQLISILTKNDFALVKILYDLSSEPDRITRSIISICEANGESLHLLKWAVGKETEETAIETTLFRTDSLATRLCKSYTSTVGLPYLRETLESCIREVLQTSNQFEVDPFRLSPSDDPDANMAHLLNTCRKFLRSIFDSVPNCPPVIRHLCAHVQKIVAVKFPESQYSAIGGFMFLRFLVSGIMYPEKYGILENPPGEQERRALILIAKVLQNLSNGAEFNGAKEGFMVPANRLIVENLQAIQTFFKSLAAVQSQETSNKFTNSIILCHTIESDTEYIYKQLSEKFDSIASELTKSTNAAQSQAPFSRPARKIEVHRVVKAKTMSRLETIRRASQVPGSLPADQSPENAPIISPRGGKARSSIFVSAAAANDGTNTQQSESLRNSASSLRVASIKFSFVCNPARFFTLDNYLNQSKDETVVCRFDSCACKAVSKHPWMDSKCRNCAHNLSLHECTNQTEQQLQPEQSEHQNPTSASTTSE